MSLTFTEAFMYKMAQNYGNLHPQSECIVVSYEPHIRNFKVSLIGQGDLPIEDLEEIVVVRRKTTEKDFQDPIFMERIFSSKGYNSTLEFAADSNDSGGGSWIGNIHRK